MTLRKVHTSVNFPECGIARGAAEDAGCICNALRHFIIPWRSVFGWQFYCALFWVHSMQIWAGWKLLLCGEFENILGGRGLTENARVVNSVLRGEICTPMRCWLVAAACAQISILCRHLLLLMRTSNVKAATTNVNGAILNVRSAVSGSDRFGRCSAGGDSPCELAGSCYTRI
jgi:hypothetical protein